MISSALGLSWKYLVATLPVMVIAVSVTACQGVTFAMRDIWVLLGIKIGVVSLITSAGFFAYGSFWSAIETIKLDLIPKLVSRYEHPFSALFAAALLILFSVAVDSYTIFVADIAAVQAVSIGLFATAVLFLFIFVLQFFIRVLADLHTLGKATESPPKKEQVQQKQE